MKTPKQPLSCVLKAFEQVPDLYLILSPELEILTASDAYLKATYTKREEITGKHLFDVFPDNPMARAAHAVKNLSRSLQQVLATRQPHRMAIQHYDVPNAVKPGGFAEKYWLPLNTPVLDEQGQVQYIIHKVEDVTEKILTENKLAREFRHLKDAQAIGHIGSFERLLTDNIITCSNEWYRLHGLEPQSEVITLDRMYSFLHPEDRQETLEAIQHTLATGKPLHLISRIVRADGHVRYVQRRAEILKDEQGMPYKVYGTVQDVTEQVEALKSAEEREALLRATEEVANLGSYELDVATMAFRFSDGMYRLFGEEPQAFVPLLAYIDGHTHPDDVPVVKAVLDQAIQNKEPYHYTRRIRRPDGTWRTLEAQGRVECQDNGQAIKLIGLVQDVTERVKAEQELEQNRELLKTTIDSSLDMIQVFEAVRNESGEILDFKWILINQTSEKIYGDVVGKSLLEHNPGVVEVGIFDTFKKVVETGIPDQSERHYVHEQFDGWFYQSTVKLGDGVATTTRDITNRKKAEQELKESEALLQSVLNNTASSIMLLKPVRNAENVIVDFQYTYTNEQILKSVNRSILVGKYFTEEFPEVAESELFHHYAQVVETGKEFHDQVDISPYGTPVWSQVYAQKLEDGLLVTYFDITERKKAEQELKESKNLLQTVFDVSLNPIAYHKAIRDESGRIVDFEFQLENRKARKYTTEDRKGQRYSEAYPGIKDTEIFRLYCQVVETGNELDTEVQLDLKGTNHWFHLMATKLGDGLVATALDITERKKAEQAITESKELLESILNTLPKGLTVFEAVRDEQGQVADLRYLLRNGYKINGDEIDHLKGRLQTEAHPGTVSTGIHEKLKQVVQTGNNADFEVHYQYEGMNAWLRVIATRFRDGVIAFTEDITERKKAQEEILRLKDEIAQRATDKYQALFNSIDDGFVILEMIYENTGKPVDFIYRENNPAFIKHVGSDLRGKRRSEVSLDKKDFLLEKYESVITTGQPVHFEYNVQKLGGQWFEATVARIGGEGSKHLGVIFRNITERIRREQNQAFLLKFSDTLRTLQVKDTIENTSLQLLSDFLCLDRAYVFELYPSEDRAVVTSEQRRADLFSLLGEVRMSDFPETVRQIEDETLVIHDVDTDARLSVLNRMSLHAVNVQAFVCASARKGERKVIWSLAAATTTPRIWTNEEVALIDEVAERTWAAVERAKAEEALRRADERYRTMTDNAPVLIWETDESGGTFANRYYTDFFGVSFEEILATGWTKLLHPEDAEGYIAAYQKAFERREPYSYECRFLRADGEYRWLLNTGHPLGENRFVGFSADITERKRLEQQQEYLLKLNDALRPLSDPIEVQRAATKVIGEYLDVDRAYYCDIEPDYEHWVVADNYVRPGVPPHISRGRIDDFGWAGEQLTAGKILCVSDVNTDPNLSESARAEFQSANITATLCIPLMKEGHWVANLALQYLSPHEWSDAEIKLAQETAERTWAAVERAKAEEALARSEEKYRTLFDSMDEGYCIIQMLYDDAGKPTDFRYLQVNQAFERNTGLHDAEGKTIRELAPDIEPKWMEIYDQVARTGSPLRFEEDSVALHHIFSLYAFRIGDPAELKVAVIFTDITERKLSQEALRKSEEQFRLFVTASSDIIFKMSADWSRMQMLTGKGFLPDNQMPNDFWVEVYIPVEDRALVRAAIQEAIHSKNTFTFELEHRVNKADGTIGWVLSHAIPVMDEQGNVLEWFGTASDITLRKQAEQKLHDLNLTLERQVAERTHELNESKQLLQTVFDTTQIQISILKAVRDEQGNILDFRIELVNKELERDTGRKDLVGKLYAAEYPGIKTAGLFDIMLEVMQTGRPKGMEYVYTSDGFDKWFSCMYVRLQDGLLATNLDITERKHAEVEHLGIKLKQQKELLIAILEAQEEERSRISESLHNGIAQILYAAKLNLDELARKVPREYTQKIHRFLKEAIEETRRVSHELVPLVLKDFGLERAIVEMCRQLQCGQLQLECEVESLETRLELYQELALYRISQELLNNIIKHSKATEAKLLLYQEEGLIHLKVRDNGIGMEGRPTKQKGIGLRSIEDRIELLNGSFNISKPASGAGTQVTITIPVKM